MGSKENMKIQDSSDTAIVANHGVSDGVYPCGSFKITCYAPDGSIRWEEESPNLVVNAGKNDLLNRYFRAVGYTANFFVGLKTAGSINAADTMLSKSWSEITGYSNTFRPTYTTVSPTTQSITNAASPAVFNISASNTVGGCFITTSNAIGGTTGTLFSAVDFATARSVVNGDTLTVTYSVSC